MLVLCQSDSLELKNVNFLFTEGIDHFSFTIFSQLDVMISLRVAIMVLAVMSGLANV